MIYGIDLGTTYSCIAYVNEFEQAEILPNFEGEKTTPSVVAYGEDVKSITIGKEAKNGQVTDSEYTVSFIKREIGKEYTPPTPFPHNQTPTEISARILKKLVDDANLAKDGAPCYDVVITCPAYFGTVAREQTKQAGIIAGLNVLRIVNEPTAAAIAYGKKYKGNGEKYILVYDLGGGTFDITLIRIRGNSYKVVVTGGNAALGGYDWDLCLAEKLLERFNRECSTDYSFANDAALKNKFMLYAEDLKKMLTAKEKTKANIGYGGYSVQFPVTRSEFDCWTKGLLDKTIELTQDLLDEAKKKGFSLSKDSDILMVGGSSRMPQVALRLHREFDPSGCKILLQDPDECVAKGAAQIGDIIEDTDTAEDMPTTFYDVTAKTYGTDIFLNGEIQVSNLIFANAALPARGDRTFATSYDNQDYIPINVYESDSREKIIKESEGICLDREHNLPLPPDLPKGSPIDVRFEVDKQGILHVQASALSQNLEFELNVKGILSEEELQRAKELLENSQEV